MLERYGTFRALCTPMPIKNVVIISVGAVLIVAGMVWYAFSTHETKDLSVSLTNPVADLVENKNLSIGARVALQDALKVFAEESISQEDIANYGIYYRELISGPVIALNQEEGFFPASLLKLPVAMWYFKKAELDPTILSNQIHFSGPKGVTEGHFVSSRLVVPGTTYTIEELIEFMLTESDNDATQILVEYAGGREVINEVYRDVGIRDVDNYDTYVIDTHTYAAFFRVLFNAEYLDQESSERILSLLTKTSFNQGLKANIPESVSVAHKFGERTIDPSVPVDQLHDCGVVYVPENPYLVCVMTQGVDYDRMAEFIGAVSEMIYKEASKGS